MPEKPDLSEDPDEEEEQDEPQVGFADSDVVPEGAKQAAEGTGQAEEKMPEGTSAENENEEEIEFPWEDLPVMEAVGKMKGAEEFQALCAELMAVAPGLVQNDLTEVLQTRAWLFSIDAGCGISTAVALFTRVIVEQKLAEVERMPIELVIPQDLNPEIGGNITKLLDQVGNRVVCLDITYWMNRARDPQFVDLLLKLYELRDHLLFVFRIPYMEQSFISEIGDALGDVFSIRTVVFSPLLTGHMAELAEERLAAAGLEADADARHLFEVRVGEEKSDGRFYGIRTVERLVDEMIYDKIRSGSEENVITRADLAGFVRYDDTNPSVTAEQELESLAGMEPVIRQLKEIAGRIRQNQEAAAAGKEPLKPMNMRFIGNPGTGKTTVGRILGRFLREKGILSRGYFFEHIGSDFIGSYPGSTSTQTMQICFDAEGSILYIDELGDLTETDPEEDGNAVREALDTLASTLMSEKGKSVVILAGTEKEIGALIKADPVFAEETPYTVTFPDFSGEELAEIFLRMVRKNGLSAGKGLDSQVRSYFGELPEKIRGAADFSNARYVKNLFEKTVSKTIARSRIDHTDRRKILASDFDLACGENKRELNRKQAEHRKIGFQV